MNALSHLRQLPLSAAFAIAILATTECSLARPNVILIMSDDRYLEAAITLPQIRELHGKEACSKHFAAKTGGGESRRI